MKFIKENLTKLVVSGLLVFIVGIVVGYSVNNGRIDSVQGFLLGAASHSSSTDSNASDSNASDSNASDANASDSNASTNDGVMYLDSFSLGKTSANPGDNVKINIKTLGACNSGVSIVFKDTTTSATFTATVKSLDTNPYVVIPKDAVATTYSVTDILLVGTNSDSSTFTLHCTDNMFECGNISNNKLTVLSNSTTTTTPIQELTLNSLSFNNTVKKGDIVSVNISASEELTSAKFEFTDVLNNTFLVSVNSFGVKTLPTFIVPSNVKTGIYNLTKVVISSKNGTSTYSKTGTPKSLDLNISLDVKENGNETYNYDNEKLDSEVINKIYKAPEGTSINLDADSNTLVKEEVFNAIKGKNKDLVINYKGNEIIFNGNDIIDPKTIDVNIGVELVKDDANISKLVNNGLVIIFADNGDLPGSAKVRIKETDNIKDVLEKTSSIYFYNEDTKNFCEVDSKVEKNGDYYEFEITHNSKYLLTNEEIDDSLIVRNDYYVSFQQSLVTNLILIGAGLFVIAIVIVIIIVLKKKNKKVKTTEI